jgi:transposase InsO family protein
VDLTGLDLNLLPVYPNIVGPNSGDQNNANRQSMSAKANPYHNAWTESFMGTLKAEMLQDGCFINAHDARTESFAYIDSYYNNHRKHSAPGYQTPAQFEAQILSLK